MTAQERKRTGANPSHPAGSGRSRSAAASTGRPRPGPGRHTRARRGTVLVAAAVSVVIVGTSFPLTTLVAQHRHLASARAGLAALQQQNRLLTEQQQLLHSPTAIRQLARADYQLVAPGQTLFTVLPGAGVPTTQGAGASGDPGAQPPVSPADAPNMSPAPGLAAAQATSSVLSGSGVPGPTSPSPAGDAHPAGAAGAVSPSGGFWHRVTSTLEFWR